MKSEKRCELSSRVTLLLLFLAALATEGGILHAQSLGIEYGVAGVENYHATSSLGFSAFFPFNDRFAGSITISQWLGEDGNFAVDLQDENFWNHGPHHYYGNNGVNLLIWYKPIDLGRFSAFVGAGLGHYESLTLGRFSDRTSTYLGAVTSAVLFKYEISANFATFVKGSIGFKAHDFLPRWGFLTAGVELKLF